MLSSHVSSARGSAQATDARGQGSPWSTAPAAGAGHALAPSTVFHRHNIISAHDCRSLLLCFYKSPGHMRTRQLRCEEQHESSKNTPQGTTVPQEEKPKMPSCFPEPQLLHPSRCLYDEIKSLVVLALLFLRSRDNAIPLVSEIMLYLLSQLLPEH